MIEAVAKVCPVPFQERKSLAKILYQLQSFCKTLQIIDGQINGRVG